LSLLHSFPTRRSSDLRGRMQIIYVLPDYYEAYPKPCYGGWGNNYLVITPSGQTLPCHGATHITTLRFDNVRDHSLDWIWRESARSEEHTSELQSRGHL